MVFIIQQMQRHQTFSGCNDYGRPARNKEVVLSAFNHWGGGPCGKTISLVTDSARRA